MSPKNTKKNPAPKPSDAPAKDAPPTTGTTPKEAAPVGSAPSTPLSDQIDALKGLDLDGLRKQYLASFGHPTASKDKDALVARISERLALAGKGAPAAKKAGRPKKGAPSSAEAAPDAEKPAKPRATKASPFASDPRIPKPGSTIERLYKGATLQVKVTETGFLHEGETYRSLSGLAKKITGAASINGLLFFRLTAPKSRPAKATVSTPAAAKKPAKAKTARKPSAKKAKR